MITFAVREPAKKTNEVLLNQVVEESPFDIKDWRQIVYSVDKLAEARGELVRHLDANLHRVRERRGSEGG
jgi:hypothetical protein